MNQNSLIEILEANRLMRSPDEVASFEQALTELAKNPASVDLPRLHLILDDACQQPEVMFGLVHFLESFELHEQLQAFIQVLPSLGKHAAEWTAILHSRIMNDAIARSAFEEKVRSLNDQEQNEVQRLILAASTILSSSQATSAA